MQVDELEIPEVKLLSPRIFQDERGYFFESFNRNTFQKLLGKDHSFVQDNQSRSKKGVLRGLHYQIINPQGKLVRVLSGEIYDVAVDIRLHSPTFGKWVGAILSSENHNMLWVPEGFAHAFLVLSEFADVLYKTTDVYNPQGERSIHYKDPEIGIKWPYQGEFFLSGKDDTAPTLQLAEVFA